MTERRSYFRVRTSARVSLCPVAEETIEQARSRVRARHVDPPIPARTMEERRLSTENRALLDIVQRMAVTLARVDQRLDDLVAAQRGETPKSMVSADPVEISISGAGFACPVNEPLEAGALLEVTLDLREAGVPLIPALVRVVRCTKAEGRSIAGLRFVEIQPEDRERIVQLTLRRQSADLRRRRMGGAR